MKRQGINDGLRNSQKKSVENTIEKLEKALKKQEKSKKVNISQLARESGISRTHIINKYSYMYEGRENETIKVLNLKKKVKDLEKKVAIQRYSYSKLELENKKLTDKLVELYSVIDILNTK